MKYRSACLSFLWVIIFLCVGGYRAAGQSGQAKYVINTTRLTVEDGLVSNTALCGLQDSRGFIWIGTRDGLERYDGKAFRLFTKEENGLQSNKINTIAEDRDGRLWIHYGSTDEALLKPGRQTDLMDLNGYGVKTIAQAFGAALPFAQEKLQWFFLTKSTIYIL